MRRIVTFAALFALTLPTTAACTSDAGGDGKTVTVAYQKFGAFTQMDDQMKKVKSEYEAAHPGSTVKLVPIEAAENDYYTKLSLMNRSPNDRTRRRVRGHVPRQHRHPGRLPRPDRRLPRQVAGLEPVHRRREDRRQGPRRQDLRRADGHRHPRALVQQGPLRQGRHHRAVGAEDLGRHARRGPHHQGQAARRHPAQRLLRQGRRRGRHHAGPRDAAVRHRPDTLYDDATEEVGRLGSQGFKDSLGFIKTIYGEKLGPDPAGRARPQLRHHRRAPSCCPSGKLAIDLDGSWLQRHLAAERRQAVAAVEHRARPGRDAHPERPGAGQGQHVRRLGAGRSARRPRTSRPRSTSSACR